MGLPQQCGESCLSIPTRRRRAVRNGDARPSTLTPHWPNILLPLAARAGNPAV